MESYPLNSFLANYHSAYISLHGAVKRDYAVLGDDYREIRDENGELVSDCELVRVVKINDPGSAKNEGVYAVFALDGDIPLNADEDIRRWIDEPDALCAEIDNFHLRAACRAHP